MNSSPFRLFLPALLLLPPSLRAQDAPTSPLPPGPVPNPAAAVPPPAPPPIPAEDTVRLQLPAGTIDAVLALYQEITDREIILDATIDPAVQLRVVTRNPLPRAEAARFIEATLMLNGLALLPTVDPGIYKLVVWTGDRAPSNEKAPELFGPASLAAMPEGDELVSYVMPLTNLEAAETAEMMGQVVRLHPYGSISVSAASNTLVITETANVVRTLIDLQRYIDVPSAQTDIRWVTLERADAERVAESMNTLLEARSEDGGRGIVQGNPNQGGAPPGGPEGQGPGQSVANNGIAGLAIVPDTRTNRILLHGRPADISYYAAIIHQFDAPNSLAGSLRRELHFVTVRDFLPVAAQALTRGNDDEVSTGAGEGALSSFDPNAQSTGQGGLQASGGLGSSASGGNNLLAAQATLDQVEDISKPDAVVVGRTLIVADNQTNSIIVTGPPEQIDIIEEIIEQIDRRPRQVMISAVVGQLNLDESDTLGVDFVRLADTEGIGGNRFTLAGQNVNGPPANIVDPLDLGDLAGFPAVGGFNVYGQIGDNLNAYINALGTSSDFSIVSRPTIFTRNSERGIISTGQSIAVPQTTTQSLVNTDNISTSIQYLNVSLQLEVIPLINSEDEVTLQIRQINDTVAGSQTIGGNEVPTLSTQGLVTTVTVPSGSTLVLGGLINEQTGTTASGIPILREIPLVGRLFGSETESTTRQELMIFIQPTIVDSEADLINTNQDEITRNEAAASAVDLANPPVWDELERHHREAVHDWRAYQSPDSVLEEPIEAEPVGRDAIYQAPVFSN